MSNEELVMLIKSGQSELMEQLYLQVRSFIYQIANRYKGYAEIDDLLQEGYLALYDAVSGYDLDQGVKFLTYADHWLKQRMRRYIDNYGACCRIPVNQKTLIHKYKKFISSFMAEYDQDPSVWEVCQYLGLSLDQLEQLKKDLLIINMDSLDRPVKGIEDDNIMLGDHVADSFNLEDEALDLVQHEQMSRELWDCVDRLNDKQSAVIRLRYQDNLSLKAIGEHQGIAPESVRQIQNKALRELRKPIMSTRLRPFVEETILSSAYRGNGVSSFNRTWTSSTERAALKLIDEKERCNRNRLN